MKTVHLVGAILIGLAIGLLIAGNANAVTFHAGACLDVPGVTTEDQHVLWAENTPGACGDAGGGWERNAGGCWTLFYFFDDGGAGGPLDPNVVQLQVRFDNTATVIKTLHDGGLPASGTQYTFCATTTGNAGSPVRPGVFQLYIRAAKTDAPGGVGNYDLNSFANGDRGALRARATLTSITASAPPAGSHFAYTGTEAVTLTTTHMQPVGDNNREVLRTDSINADGTVRETGAATDRDGTSYTQAFTIDSTYALALQTYGARVVIAEEAGLLEGDPNFGPTEELWTIFRSDGHGTGIEYVSNSTVRKVGLFSADPRLRVDVHTQRDTPRVNDDFPSENATEEVTFTIGEDNIFVWCHVANSRLEDLDTASNTVVISLLDPDFVVKATLTTQTGADGWTADSGTGRLQHAADPPADTWHARCAVSLTGASKTLDQDVIFVSAFTGDKVVRLFIDGTQHVGENSRICVRTQIRENGRTPDFVPELHIGHVVAGTPDAVVSLLVVNLTNVINGEEEPLGSLYCTDAWTPSVPCICSAVVFANITGTTVYTSQSFEVSDVFEIQGLGPEQLTQLLVWGLVTVFAMYRNLAFLAFGSTISFFRPIVEGWPITFIGGIVLCLLLLWVEYITRNQLLARWMNPRENSAE